MVLFRPILNCDRIVERERAIAMWMWVLPRNSSTHKQIYQQSKTPVQFRAVSSIVLVGIIMQVCIKFSRIQLAGWLLSLVFVCGFLAWLNLTFRYNCKIVKYVPTFSFCTVPPRREEKCYMHKYCCIPLERRGLAWSLPSRDKIQHCLGVIMR